MGTLVKTAPMHAIVPTVQAVTMFRATVLMVNVNLDGLKVTAALQGSRCRSPLAPIATK
ncbi:hypothetical protein DPMN_159881 [Dreissena polymorpha]|uniref:Uncharacterized protein n=1 Tax=Dreissena polymorpha TaxID=45954 RepID=A0A9D4IN92_DREPO|nr:hypothetical protein DPMN_159881 [Dreissena polymorpha]